MEISQTRIFKEINMELLFCIKHEEMVAPTGGGHLMVEETEPGLPELNLCEFSEGWATCPPSPQLEGEWQDYMSPPSDEEFEFTDAEAQYGQG